MDQLQILSQEITGDPLNRGYGLMTNAEAADSLNTEDRPGPDRDSLDGEELFREVIEPVEYAALTADQKDWLRIMAGLTNLDVSPGGRFLIQFDVIFPSGTTRDNMAALKAVNISRATEIGLRGKVLEGHVQAVRGEQ